MSSYYRDGKLYQGYRVYQNKKVPYRNRAEKMLVEWVIEFLKDPVALSINELNTHIKNYYNTHFSYAGYCHITDVKLSSSIAGHDNWRSGSFGIYGTGRGTYTLNINQELFFDTDTGNPVTDLVFNKIEQH